MRMIQIQDNIVEQKNLKDKLETEQEKLHMEYNKVRLWTLQALASIFFFFHFFSFLSIAHLFWPLVLKQRHAHQEIMKRCWNIIQGACGKLLNSY